MPLSLTAVGLRCHLGENDVWTLARFSPFFGPQLQGTDESYIGAVRLGRQPLKG